MNGQYKQWTISILKAARDEGMIAPHLPAMAVLESKYPTLTEKGHSDGKLMGRWLDGLIHEGYLTPSENSTVARGITVKGMLLLDDLERTRINWCKQNWFPLVIATSTILSTLVAIVIALAGGLERTL